MKTKILFVVLAGMTAAGNIMGQPYWTPATSPDRMYIDGPTTTNVGIGATSPTNKLNLLHRGDCGIDINSQPYPTYGSPHINFQLDGTTTFAVGVDDSDGDKFKIGTSAFNTNTRVTIISDGNVGINTTSPGFKLQVSGGDIDAATSTNGYRIGGNYVLWHNNKSGCIYVGTRNNSTTSTGTNNTFAGHLAGNANTTGANNTFTGKDAGLSNNTGGNNTFMGYQAGKINTAGDYLCAFGYTAGAANTTGDYNTFVGSYSGGLNTGGGWNTYLGFGSGNYTTTADSNVYIGHVAGWQNETGNGNTICGVAAGRGVSANSYSYNTYMGLRSGYSTSTGSNNTAIGAKSGYTITSGSNNTFLGYGADAGASGAIERTAIGYNAVNSQADYTIWLGNSTTNKVYVAALGSYNVGSDGRFKFNVNEDVKGLEFIKKLRPVTYQVDAKKFDDFQIQNFPDSIKTEHQQGMDFTSASNIRQSGFIAQEVASAANSCGFSSTIVSIPTDSNISSYAINYAEIVVPLVKALQEQQIMIDSLMQLVSQCCVPKQERKGNTGDNSGENNLNDKENYQNGNAINVELSSPDRTILYQNIPNPFGNETTINYYLPENIQTGRMVFYDIMGRVIKEVVLEQKGNASVVVNSEKLSSGIYSYSIVVDDKVVDTLKMQRVK